MICSCASGSDLGSERRIIVCQSFNGSSLIIEGNAQKFDFGMGESAICGADPIFRVLSLIRTLCQHIRIIAQPIGTFISINWDFVRSVYDVFVNTANLGISPLTESPLNRLHAYGLVGTGGGTLLMFVTILVGNFGSKVGLPIYIVLLINWIF
jgi:hypothetical protein